MIVNHDRGDSIFYKFKYLEPFVQITDLLLTKRLYCPRPSELNDPLEGILGITLPMSPANAEQHPLKRAMRFWAEAEAELNRYRVCCFSAHPRSLPMWSYYGNGHSGICLELDGLLLNAPPSPSRIATSPPRRRRSPPATPRIPAGPLYAPQQTLHEAHVRAAGLL